MSESVEDWSVRQVGDGRDLRDGKGCRGRGLPARTDKLAKRRNRQHGERRFGIAGTPTDAVMMAVGHLMKDARPDLILSGVNRGANLAEDVTYSGTVSAAMEGAIMGVRTSGMLMVVKRTLLSANSGAAHHENASSAALDAT